MGEAAAKEPSMEDILSSIRKIISEENPSEDGAVSSAEPSNSTGATPSSNSTAEVSAPPQTTVSTNADPVETPASGTTSLQKLADEARAAQSGLAEAQISSPEISAPIPQRESSIPEPQSSGPLSDIAASVAASEAAYQESTTPQETSGGISAAETNSEITQEPNFESINSAAEERQPVAMDTQGSVAATAANAASEPYEPTKAEEEAFKGALVSPSTDSAVNDSFERLKRSAMDDIEAKTEVILRPMLREWLDNNLPSLVERLVREEIERVSRGI